MIVSYARKKDNIAVGKDGQKRQKRNMTQKQLSEESGVSLRMIQLYEQRQNDINKTAGIVINKLAWVLKCNFYEIMEIDLDE